MGRVAALREKDGSRRVFGANGHRYELRLALTAAEVAAAERQFGVAFPTDYRTFLLDVGRGGAGPGYGIFPLVHARGVWRWEGDGGDLVTDLRKPFPHAAAWNPTYRAFEDGVDGEQEREDEDAYWAGRDAWDAALYFAPEQTHGAICICHEGCAIRDWLVVTGAERGHVWVDDRANDGGLVPRDRNGARVTFAEWYLAWLENAERDAR